MRIQSNLILELIYKRRGNVEGHDCKHLRKALSVVVTTILPGAVCHKLLEGCWNTLRAFPYFLRHHQLTALVSTAIYIFQKRANRVQKGLIYGEGRFAGAELSVYKSFP